MRRKYSEQAMRQLHIAIENNDLEKVIELLDSGEVGVTNIECAMTVRFNSLKILEYFLEKVSDILSVLNYGLELAIKDKNMEAIEIIITAFKKNSYQYKFMDDVILAAIEQVIYENKYNTKDGTEALKLVKYIVDTYYGE